jgi:UDP-N-acetylglucosamine acyltransferase
MSIHPTAVIESGAELGVGVEAGPFAYVQSGARVGDRCRLGPHVCVYRGVTLGTECQVHAGAVLGDAPQDLAYKNEESFAVIGERCIIREGVTIHRGTKAGTATTIGQECFLMGFSHFAHNVALGNRVIVANGALLAGYVEVGDQTFISGNAGIHQFVRIGRLAMIGGAGGISKDVPPFCTTVSVALNSIAGLNSIGLRRAGFTPADRLAVKQAFQRVYRSGLNVSQALASLKKDGPPEGPVREFCDFIERSKRGICALGTAADGEEAS